MVSTLGRSWEISLQVLDEPHLVERRAEGVGVLLQAQCLELMVSISGGLQYTTLWDTSEQRQSGCYVRPGVSGVCVWREVGH